MSLLSRAARWAGVSEAELVEAARIVRSSPRESIAAIADETRLVVKEWIGLPTKPEAKP